jgi:hypothetical protein
VERNWDGWYIPPAHPMRRDASNWLLSRRGGSTDPVGRRVLTGVLWMRPSPGIFPVAAGAHMDAWLKTAGFQSITSLSSSKKVGTGSETWNVLESSK